ncbi:TIR-like protein FxsC [Dactylosporangium sp. NPDC049525]|uniref:TIR-like protein FxsC n=1 Tax=Dactylosporangium sp. NPDC049525 TaxID=3154730 RepID=UPI003422E8AF
MGDAMARGKPDFFISYTAADRPWAEWIAVNLERAGYTTFIQAFDILPGSDFAHAMQAGVDSAKRILAVLSPAYLNSAFGESEWRVAFAEDPTGEKRLLLPVLVEPCTPPGLLKTRVYVDLTGFDETAALAKLLAAVDPDRPRPTSAPFPGAVAAEPQPQVPFPGRSTPVVLGRAADGPTASVAVEAGGDPKAVAVTVCADADASLDQVWIEVDSLPTGVGCVSGCGSLFSVPAGETVQRTIYLRAEAHAAAGAATGTVRVGGVGEPGIAASLSLAVRRPTPTGVEEVAGTVTDAATGHGLAGVRVIVADGGGHTYSVMTDDSGQFSFLNTSSMPIAAGTVRIAAVKSGFTAPLSSLTVAAGQKATDIAITMERDLVVARTGEPAALPRDELLDGPVFYVSYARSRTGAGNAAVQTFFDDLVADLDQIMAVDHGRDIGYLDGMLPAGTGWEGQLLHVLNTCQVFVALLSEAYLFRSEWCPRSWDAFGRRRTVRRDGRPGFTSGIIPVLWAPIHTGIPPRVAAVQRFTPARSVKRYEAEGLLGLQKLDKQLYQETVWSLALEIRKRTAEVRVERGSMTSTHDLRHSFRPAD